MSLRSEFRSRSRPFLNQSRHGYPLSALMTSRLSAYLCGYGILPPTPKQLLAKITEPAWSSLPREGVRFHVLTIRVQFGFEQKYGRDAAGHFLHVADFLFRQGAAQEFFFAVGEPLLHDLVAADSVFPNSQRNV